MEEKSNMAIESIKTIVGLYVKIVTKLFDLYSVKTIDQIGTLIGLDVDGKQISQQSTNELLIGLNGLYTKISNPEVQAKLIQLIKELSPILQQAAGSLVSIMTNLAALMVKQGINLMCAVPPINMMCSATNMLSAAGNFGASFFEHSEELKESFDKTIDKLNGFLGDANKIPSFSEGYNKMNTYIQNNPKYQQLMTKGQGYLTQGQDYAQNLVNKGQDYAQNLMDMNPQDYAKNIKKKAYENFPVTARLANAGLNMATGVVKKGVDLVTNKNPSESNSWFPISKKKQDQGVNVGTEVESPKSNSWFPISKKTKGGGGRTRKARRSRKTITNRLRKSIKNFLTG